MKVIPILHLKVIICQWGHIRFLQIKQSLKRVRGDTVIEYPHVHIGLERRTLPQSLNYHVALVTLRKNYRRYQLQNIYRSEHRYRLSESTGQLRGSLVF